MVEIGDIRELLDRLDLLVVAGIPAYNEEKTIARVVLGAQKHAHVVIVCDDGSTDLTGEIAERLGAVVVRHERNAGYGAAMQSLFKRAWALKADVFVTLDADGQHDPAEIPRLVKPIKDGVAEVVLGSRFMDKNGTADMPTYRQFGVKVITTLANGSGKNGVSDAQSGFRAYSKRAMEQLGDISENGMSASIELLRAVHKSGLKICEVPISCKYADTVGIKTSTENAAKHGMGLLMSLIKLVVEDRPLPFLGIPGIMFIALGTLFGVWMMDIYASTHSIVTNVALASIAFILIGFFMVSTAITLYAITRLSKKMNVN
ncbi:MAG: glycosyltransferase family 2 protein [Candidatus Bathyarchaeia archaeon]